MNHRAFQDQLAQFPVNTADILQQLIHQQGRLEPEQVNELKGLMALSSENLLKALLPLAASMSTCPISHFSVGAIVEGFRSEGQGPIYLGANLEMAGQPLKMAIHAEQAAISNAWHQGETRLRRLMVNEAPCGHCRQFMNELNEIDQMDILVSQLDSDQQRQYSISSLLPDAFGPGDLKQSTRLMSPSLLSLESPVPADELVNAATEAAQRSYAPYTNRIF
ncbi:cytidine deaminase [Endozoicomonas atrinae]|uniref:cytidine deaminase n=1 Tax=Endozoicomonas atrinae TaxID=1333660 RepID=UPI000826391B|nr:cytidine deaminase [Endozoicomonas atrinae]